MSSASESRREPILFTFPAQVMQVPFCPGDLLRFSATHAFYRRRSQPQKGTCDTCMLLPLELQGKAAVEVQELGLVETLVAGLDVLGLGSQP